MLIQMDRDMAPLQKKNQPKVHGIDENKLRLDGAKHVDLWAKGELFPVDPKTNLHPDFKSITGLVKFLCHGKQGLLGYCENLKGDYTEAIERNNQLEMRNYHLEMRNKQLEMMSNQLGLRSTHLEMRNYQLEMSNNELEMSNKNFVGTIKQLQDNNMILGNENNSFKQIISVQCKSIEEKNQEITRLLNEKCHLTEEVMNIKTEPD